MSAFLSINAPMNRWGAGSREESFYGFPAGGSIAGWRSEVEAGGRRKGAGGRGVCWGCGIARPDPHAVSAPRAGKY
jgi:hypothetical protein